MDQSSTVGVSLKLALLELYFCRCSHQVSVTFLRWENGTNFTGLTNNYCSLEPVLEVNQVRNSFMWCRMSIQLVFSLFQRKAPSFYLVHFPNSLDFFSHKLFSLSDKHSNNFQTDLRGVELVSLFKSILIVWEHFIGSQKLRVFS